MTKKLPTMKPVESSNIDAMGHDGKDLAVRFKGGAVYLYHGVPKATFEAALKAESVGTYFRLHVRGAFPHVKHDG